jgi:hypothetical protein
MEEYGTIEAMWRHHMDLLDHRRTELQDHYIDQGEDLKVFYTVLLASRADSTSPSSSSSGEEVEVEGEGEEAHAPVKKALDFVPMSSLNDVQLPVLPLDFEATLQVLLPLSLHGRYVILYYVIYSVYSSFFTWLICNYLS